MNEWGYVFIWLLVFLVAWREIIKKSHQIEDKGKAAEFRSEKTVLALVWPFTAFFLFGMLITGVFLVGLGMAGAKKE